MNLFVVSPASGVPSALDHLAPLVTALTGGVDPAKVQAGYFGMGVVAVLAVGTYLLIRSFRHQMRKMSTSELPHEPLRPHGPRPALRLPVAQPPGPGGSDAGDPAGESQTGTLGPGA